MRLRQPVVVFGATSWLSVPLGATVRVGGHLSASTRGDVAASLSTRDPPTVTAGPDPWWRASGRVRAALRESVAGLPPDRRALGAGPGGRRRRRPRPGARRRLPHDRADPPAGGVGHQPDAGGRVRAGAWPGGCAYAGAGSTSSAPPGSPGSCCSRGPSRACCGPRRWGRWRCSGWAPTAPTAASAALGVATLVLLLLDPGWPRRSGSACRCSPPPASCCSRRAWRDALARWLPRWLAEAVAVPAAAQLACTPLVAAISGQVSLVAVAGQPARGAGGGAGHGARAARWCGDALVAPAAGPAGRRRRGWCVAWIVAVARARCRACPTPAIGVGERTARDRRARGAECRGGAVGPAAAAPPVDRARLLRCCSSSPCWSASRHPGGRRTAG